MEILPLIIAHHIDLLQHVLKFHVTGYAQLFQFLLPEPIAVLIGDKHDFVFGTLGVNDIFVPDPFASALLTNLNPGPALDADRGGALAELPYYIFTSDHRMLELYFMNKEY